jgi:hypothetical protein
MTLREAKAPATGTIAPGDVLSDPACVFNERTKATTQEHAPQEEEHRRNNVEAEEKAAHEEEVLAKWCAAEARFAEVDLRMSGPRRIVILRVTVREFTASARAASESGLTFAENMIPDY